MQENCYIPTQKNNWIKSPKETTDRESSVAHFDRSGWSHWAHGLSLPLMSPVLIIKTKRKPPTAKITVLLLSFAYVMAFLATASSSCSRRLGSPQLPHPLPSISRCTPSFPLVSFPNSISLHAHRAGARVVGVVAAAAAAGKSSSNAIQNDKNVKKAEEEEETIEVEEELPWIQEKALDLVEFTGSVTQAIPGPRVGQSSLPWILALPLAYAGITFVIAFVKTVKKFGSPRYKRKKLVNKNAMLCKSIDGLFQKGEGKVGADASSQQHVALEGMEKRTGFTMVDIVRKYIRYALNEKPFNPELVASLIQFRKASMLDDSQVAEILNDISRRIVREKGPVVMNMSGYSEKGFKRKLAVQALFGKVFYLSELPEFCSRNSSLIVKEIFGVADEDADKLRLHTLSEAGNMDSLEKMVDDSDSEDSNGKTSDGSDSEYSNEKTSNAP